MTMLPAVLKKIEKKPKNPVNLEIYNTFVRNSNDIKKKLTDLNEKIYESVVESHEKASETEKSIMSNIKKAIPDISVPSDILSHGGFRATKKAGKSKKIKKTRKQKK